MGGSVMVIDMATSWGTFESSGVKLDDQVLFDQGLHFSPVRGSGDAYRQLSRGLQPRGPGAVAEYFLRALDGLDIAAAGAHRAHHARPQQHAGNVGGADVDGEVAVTDKLAGLGARAAETGAVDDVVEPQLEAPEELKACLALGFGGVLVVVAELGLENPIYAPRALLGAQLDAEV